jgi:hypothetical protein
MQSGRQNKKERKFQIPSTKDYRQVVGCMNARAYKNILEGINMFFTDPDYRTVEFVGSGGSSEVGGSNGPDSKAALDTNKVVGLLPHNQQLNNINKVLIECTVNDRIVALFIHSSVCNAIQSMYGTICGQVDFTVPNMIKRMKHMYICLGYFSLDSSYVASGESISSIRERYKDMPKTMAGHFLRFLESKKFIILGTLLDDKLLEGLPVRDCCIGVGSIVCTKKWSIYTILQDVHERVLMPVSKKDIKSALGLSDASISVEDICRYHVQSIIQDKDNAYGFRDLSLLFHGKHLIPICKQFKTQDKYNKLQLF